MKRKNFLKASGIATAGLGVGTPLMANSLNFILSKAGSGTPKFVRSNEGNKLNVLGDQMTLKLTGEDTGGQYVLIEQNNNPGVGIPLHTHDNEDEIFRVIEGELELNVNGAKTILKAGDLGFCPRGIPHTWKVVGNSPAKVDLSFFPSGMEKMFEELAKLPSGPPDMAKVTEITTRYGVHFV